MTADGVAEVRQKAPLGILAGGGGLPEQIAEIVTAKGRSIHIVAIDGEADASIFRFPHTKVNWGAIGRMTGSLKAAGCQEMIIVGSVTRPDPRKVRPDLGLIKAIPTIIRLFGGGDDHVLRNVVRFFEAQGFTVRGVADVAPELLAAPGALGKIAPAPSFAADVAKGFAMIEALGFADVGQAVVIANGRVLAIEAAEGTDRMLIRLKQVDDRQLAGLPAEGRDALGGLLVKRPKPGQELRVDLPAIGPTTIRWCANAGLAGIAVEAGKVLIADRDRAVESANAGGLFIAGLNARSATPLVDRGPLAVAALNRLAISARVRRDIARAVAVAAAVSRFAASAGVVVVRRHVIAIETGEGLHRMFERVRELRQWGATARSKRRGVLAVTAEGLERAGIEATITAAAEAGLAGVILPAGTAFGVADRAGRIAEEQGIALAEVQLEWSEAAR